MKCQAKVNQSNPDWLLCAVHKHYVIRPDISVDKPTGAEMPKGCGHLPNNRSDLWNMETFSSVLHIFT